MRRSPLGLPTAACFRTCRLLVANLRGRPARYYNHCDAGMAFGLCVAMEDPVQLSKIDLLLEGGIGISVPQCKRGMAGQ